MYRVSGIHPDEAKKSLLEAIGLFIEECDEMGTLEEVLEESGFLKEPDMTDDYIRNLLITFPIRKPVICDAIRAMDLPIGSRGLDAGCGIGSLTFLLSDAVGPCGHVTGIDISSEMLDYARKTAETYGLSPRAAFQNGDANSLPFDDHTFDWALSVDCVGYSPQTPLSAVKELERVVKPGGISGILFWSSQQLLPGYPELEARLNATAQGIAPFKRHSEPESHPLRAAGVFRKAGLSHIRTGTFAGNIFAPLSEEVRDALIATIRMRWGDEAPPELDREDRLLYRRLCQPESPDFILDCPDYYAFFIYSLFTGRVI